MLPLHKLALRCFALVCLFIALPHALTSALAQSSATKPLIVEKVNESQLVKLEGNTPPAAIASNDRGRVSSAMLMDGLILVLRRSPEQQSAFDSFVASQYDATSPNYHHWLAPEEVGEKFGPAPADIATVSSWLSSHGLSVDGVSKDRMTIRFSGSAVQVEEAFHTEIHSLIVKGEPHISNMTDPQIPMALDPVVLGPKALHNFIPRPLHRMGSKVVLNQETGKGERVATGNATSLSPRPEMGFGCGTNCQIEDVAPNDFAAIYNVLPLWNATSPIDGTGQTIAIVGRSDVRAADVASFRSTFKLTGGAFNLIKNGTDPGFCTGTTGNCTLDDQVENALDVEWSGAVAKGATVDLVVTQQTTTNDAIFESAQYIISHNTAPVLNVSYGQCELFLGTSGNTAWNNLWQSASTAGIAVFVATGDSGSPSCDQDTASANGPYGAQYGLSVSGIASTQNDTAVGGTDLNWGSTAAPYWNSTNNGTNGSTANGYVPEVPWNDTCTNPIIVSILNGQLGQSLSANQMCDEIANHVITSTSNEQGLLDLVSVVGGSGGASNCTVNTTSNTVNPDPTSCSGGYAKPSWQAGVTGIPTDTKRDIPDVSFFAGNGFLGSAYVICVSDAGVCLASASSTTEPSGEEVGGTSVASPAMAGVMALINQKAGSSQGNPNSELYKLAGQQTYSSCSAETVTSSSSGCYFNDIDTGTIAMACAAGSPSCTLATAGNTYGELTGFAAGTGYDEATGLGSLNVANVVNAWPSVIGTATATVAASASPSSITSAQGTTVTVTVTGGSGTPTGTVVLTSGSFTSATKSLASGTVTFSITAGQLAVGSDTVKASYSGDATYAAGSGNATVTVTQAVLLTPTVTVTPAAGSISANQSLSVSVGVTGTGAIPSGSVALSGGGYTSSSQTLVSGSTTFTIPANGLNAGADVLTATYTGDANYTSGSGSANVTVNAVSQGSPEGAYLGSASNGETFETIVLPDNTFYALYGTTAGNLFTVAGMITGKATISNGTLSASIHDYYYTGAVYTGTVSATYVAGTSISGTITDSGVGTLTFSGTFIPSSQFNFNTAASISELTGSWAGALLGGTAASANVSAGGSFTGSSQGCSYSGTVTPDSSGKNFFDFSLTFAATGCVAPNQTFTGIAVEYLLADGVTHQLLAAFSNSTAGDVFIATSSGSSGSGKFQLNASTPAAINPGGSATSTVTVSATNGYSGTVTLACALNSGGPSNQAGDSPVCTAQTSAVAAGSAGTVTVTTTAASTAAMKKPSIGGWNAAEGGAVLAMLVWFGIPSRRRGLRAMLGAVVMLATLGSIAACGGGGGSSSGGGGGSANPGTTAGTYTFTITGTGNPAVSPAPTATFTVKVN